jgi:membrane associated rhomboid family serine protease
MKSKKCPHCRIYLLDPANPYYGVIVEVDVCTHCGGLWLEKDELAKIISKNILNFSVDDAFVIEDLGELLGKSKLNCPNCGIRLNIYKLLNVYETIKESDVEIDVCEKCSGIWLEKGELDYAMRLPRHEISEAMKALERERTQAHWLFQFFSTLPVEFNIKPRKMPIVTSVLILLNTIVMAVMLFQDSPETLVNQWALTPGSSKTLFWFITVITHQFMHADLIHLLGNMYFLYILGDNLEDAMGHLKYLAFYLICGCMGAFSHVILTSSPEIPMLGASGAISGIMAGYTVIYRKARLTFMFIYWQRKLPAIWYFTIWIAFNFLGIIGGDFGVAWFGHLGGFAAGLAGAFLIYDSILDKKPILKYINQTQKI